MQRPKNSNSSIQFVYFDLGNVVLNFSHQIACEQIAKISGVQVDRVWAALFESTLVGEYEIGQISDVQFHAGFCQATQSSVQLEPFLSAFSDIFWLNESVMELATELSQRAFPIGILSNTCAAHWSFALARFPQIGDCFGDRILSFEEASAKPDQGIYEAAIRKAKVSPGSIFFVDDRADNVAGAIAAGLDAVIFESAEQLRLALEQRGVW